MSIGKRIYRLRLACVMIFVLSGAFFTVLPDSKAQPLDLEHKVTKTLSDKVNSVLPNENVRVIILLKKPVGQFNAQVARSSVKDGILAGGGKVKREYSIFDGMAAEIPASKVAALANNPDVELIEYDHSVRAFINESIPLINADDVWNKVQSSQNITGVGQTVCVIDSGVNYSNSFFGGDIGSNYTVIGGYDFVNDDTDPMDDYHHGTHVAGIVASVDSVYQGVSPGAKIVAIKSLDQNGSGFSSDIIAGIDWCVNNAVSYNISVISMSLGIDSYNNDTYCDSDFPSFTTAIDSAIAKNISVVVATGNEYNHSGVSSPACIYNSTRVTATSKTDSFASFANRGGQFDDILAAPGLYIWSADYADDKDVLPLSGTSMATPHVSGLFALLNQGYKTIHGTNPTPDYLFNITNSTGRFLYDSETSKNYSRIDALAAYKAIDPILPSITFVAPTPQNNSNLSQNYVFVNVTASESLSTALLEWNGTNVTMSSGSWYSNQTELADGTYTYRVWGNDLGGNWNVTETRVVNIDTIAPTITIHSPENKTTNDTIPLLNATFDEPVNTAWYNNGTTDSAHYYSVSNLTLNLTTLEEGPHNVTVYANDSFGNLNYSTVYFTVDTTPPNVTITNPVDGETIKVFNNTVRGTVFDIVSTIYKVNITGNGTGPIEVDVANGEFSYVISYVNGSNTIVVNATDAAGYTGSANVTVTVIKELQWNVSTTNESGMFMWDVNAGDMDIRINLSTGNQSVNGTMNITAHALAADAGSSTMDANAGSWETHLGKFFEINVSDNLGETNLSWAEIRVDYLQEEVNAAKLAEESLALYWDNGGTWERLTNQSWVYNTGINTTNADGYSGYVWANLSHFSTYSVAGQYRADLTVSNVTFSDPTPMDGDVIVINVTVDNTNATDANNFTVELLVNGTSQTNTLSVKSNSTNTTQFNWTSINGTHDITIVADAGGTITEVNETNNNATAQITVNTKPDLSVGNITFSESSPTDGDVITINATISNSGETGAVGFNVSFLVDGTRQANNTLLVVAGSTNTTQFTWTSVQGTRNITVVADADNTINESNETNNNATAQITVQAKQSPPSGGGGGGGSSSKTLAEYIKSIAPGETGSVTFDLSKSPYITEITITAHAKLRNVKISLEMLNKKPNPFFSDPVGLVLSYLKITKSNIPTGGIEKADITFRVEKGWLKENDINQASVVLSREVKKEWEKLPTAQLDEDQEYIYYSAETPGFSFFVVTADKGSGYVKEELAKIESVTETAPTPSKAKEVTPLKEVETETLPPATPQKEEPDRKGTFMIVGILALLTMAMGLYLKNKPKP